MTLVDVLATLVGIVLISPTAQLVLGLFLVGCCMPILGRAVVRGITRTVRDEWYREVNPFR